MKDALATIAILLFVVYVAVSLGTVVVGIHDESNYYLDGCKPYKKATRARRLLPAYELGCWLGSVPNE